MLISRQKLADEIGVTPDTLRGWQQLHWAKGLHFVVIGKTTLIDRGEVEAWLRSHQGLKDRAGDSELESTGEDRRTRRLIREAVTQAISAEQ